MLGSLDSSEVEMIQRMMDDIVKIMHGEEKPSERRRKDHEMLKNINSRSSVPRYDRDEKALRSMG